MINVQELHNAQIRANEAVESLYRISKLPQDVGQSVKWINGAVWTRVGDDAWKTNDVPDRYPSAHVAMFSWVT